MHRGGWGARVVSILPAERHGQRQIAGWRATLAAGTVFGEMGLIEENRSADVWADTSVQCLELPLDEFAGFREKYPQVGERIIRNLAVLLAKRLILANTKIELLTSY